MMEEGSQFEIETFQSGTVIAERYQIESLIGSGGMATVYLVKDLHSEGKRVAMKILHPQFAQDKVYVQRFLREVQLMNKVDHRNVVKTYDIGTDDGLIYFTMEYVPAQSLETIMERCSFSESQIAKLILEICKGLDAIHRVGIMHRDLKPANILVMGDSSIKITDFGVAREKYSRLTAKTQKVGSICYMAPEVWLGKKPTPAIDFYGLGVMLYEIATGQLPFEHDWPGEVMRKHLEEAPEPPASLNPRVPPWLNDLIMRLLSKSPKERPRSAEKVEVFVKLYGPSRSNSGILEEGLLLEDREAFRGFECLPDDGIVDERILQREEEKKKKTYVFQLTATRLLNDAQLEGGESKRRKATMVLRLPRRAALIFEIEPPSKDFIFLGVFLASLQVFDGVLTNMGLKKWGVEAEGNPLLRYLIEHYGPDQTLVIVKLAAIVLVAVLTFFAKKMKWVKNLIGFLSCLYLFGAVLPWLLLLMFKYHH